MKQSTIKKLLAIGFILIGFVYLATRTREYSGAYQWDGHQGFASYSYKNGKKGKVMEGNFQFTSFSPNEKITVSGTFRNGQKEGLWMLKKNNYKITGFYNNDSPVGQWTIISENPLLSGIPHYSKATITYGDQILTGPFSYEGYIPTPAKAISYKLSVKGNFDKEGYATGKWEIKFNDMDGKPFFEEREYYKGLLLKQGNIILADSASISLLNDKKQLNQIFLLHSNSLLQEVEINGDFYTVKDVEKYFTHDMASYAIEAALEKGALTGNFNHNFHPAFREVVKIVPLSSF